MQKTESDFPSADGTPKKILTFEPNDPLTSGRDVVLFLLGSTHTPDRILNHRAYTDAANPEASFVNLATEAGLTLVVPNEQGNWMKPNSQVDIQLMAEDIRAKYQPRYTLLAGASMGGHGTTLVAGKYPELFNGHLAFHTVSDMNSLYHHFDTTPDLSLLRDMLIKSYGGTPNEMPKTYIDQSPVTHINKLQRPLVVIHGEADEVLPVRFARNLAVNANQRLLSYTEIAGGSHDGVVNPHALMSQLQSLRGNLR